MEGRERHGSRAIQLRRLWKLGRRLGEGGFAHVHEAVAENGDTGALKLIPKQPGAERELLFEDLAGVPNVIPIIDAGEWTDYWVIVMPRAERSLREHLRLAGGRLAPADATRVLGDIAAALVGLGGRVVHRDIKPENTLLWNDRWCLADFGIARYAEASTAPDTKKFAWTVAYAAPERWRAERATGATDVYAVGVMAHELLSGALPFPGPTDEDFREQHLHADPPRLDGVPPALAALVRECLHKAPEARPTAKALAERLERSARPLSPAAERLRDAHEAEVRRASEAAARASAERSGEERANELYRAAKASDEEIAGRLRRAVLDAAPSTQPLPFPGRSWVLSLGRASLAVTECTRTPRNAFQHYRPVFEVIAHYVIRLQVPLDRFGYEGRSHSLWFCDARTAGEFHWYETAFMTFGASRSEDPFAMEPSDEAGVAIAPVTGEYQVAWPFTQVDQGGEDEFIDRWIGWLAEAVNGQLRHPSRMPERDAEGSWRQR